LNICKKHYEMKMPASQEPHIRTPLPYCKPASSAAECLYTTGIKDVN
jgi:hypothetical protein